MWFISNLPPETQVNKYPLADVALFKFDPLEPGVYIEKARRVSIFKVGSLITV